MPLFLMKFTEIVTQLTCNNIFLIDILPTKFLQIRVYENSDISYQNNNRHLSYNKNDFDNIRVPYSVIFLRGAVVVKRSN